MKDKRIVVNPFRMMSPKLDSEALKIEELHERPVSEAFGLDEGLLVMLSKLLEMSRLIHEGFLKNCPEELNACDKLAVEVHQQEKMLTNNIACSISVPKEVCRAFILFPGHAERIGDYLESILTCCRIKCHEDITFDDRAMDEVNEMFRLSQSLLNDFRDCVITPNKFLLEHVIKSATTLDEKCQGWELAHVDRLLAGATAPKASSLYLDMLESTQSVSRHLKEMAQKLLDLIGQLEAA
jgi:Na+/phosphate symporter